MRFYLIMIVCFALFVVGMTTVRQQADTIRLGYRLHETDLELLELREEIKQYSLGVEALRSPRRIFAYARTLSLSPPADGDVRIERAEVPDGDGYEGETPEDPPELRSEDPDRRLPLAVLAPGGTVIRRGTSPLLDRS